MHTQMTIYINITHACILDNLSRVHICIHMLAFACVCISICTGSLDDTGGCHVCVCSDTDASAKRRSSDVRRPDTASYATADATAKLRSSESTHCDLLVPDVHDHDARAPSGLRPAVREH